MGIQSLTRLGFRQLGKSNYYRRILGEDFGRLRTLFAKVDNRGETVKFIERVSHLNSPRGSRVEFDVKNLRNGMEFRYDIGNRYFQKSTYDNNMFKNSANVFLSDDGKTVRGINTEIAGTISHTRDYVSTPNLAYTNMSNAIKEGLPNGKMFFSAIV